MELNVDKIKKEMKRLDWSFEDLARECKLNSRQHAHFLLNPKKLRAADIFAKALNLDPKDLIK